MQTKEQLLEYLRLFDSNLGFRELNEFVIQREICTLCGTCLALCPRIGVKEEKPALVAYDPECSMCIRFCSRTYFPDQILEKTLFQNRIPKNYLIGNYQRITNAKSTDEGVKEVAQNGGVVSTLLMHALNTGFVDGVLLTNRNENWLPKPVVVTKPDEILSVAGSKYTIAPTLLAYNEAVCQYKLKNLAIVGMPCQIQAVRKLQLYPPLSDEFGKFKLVIGLYCSSNFSYDLVKNYIPGELGIPLENIVKMDIAHGKFIIFTNDGVVKEIPLKEIKAYTWPSCRYCKDYTAEFADISVGSVGAPADDWNSVIIRTKVGEEIFDLAVSTGKISATQKTDLSKIEKECFRKKSRITKLNKSVTDAMQFFNIPDNELEIYTVLMSIGFTNAPMLSKVLKIEESKIQNILEALKQRGWVLENGGMYRPVNPTKVIANEIAKLKRNLEKNIMRIKSEALVDLEALYLQNNLKDVQSKEFFDNFF